MMEIYIVVHNQESLQWFKDHNKDIDISKFKFILVGDWNGVSETMKEECIVASFLSDNIEKYKSLLTFTAWYALIKNNLIKSKYIGIFEYDCIFYKDIFELKDELDYNTVLAFAPISTKHLYLDLIPEFCALLDKEEIEIAKKKELWAASTNVIMPVWFLDSFVSWYLNFIPEILKYPKHPHFHERAVNVFAAGCDVDCKFYGGYIEHLQLCSHKIKLQK
jgi:hypothetical protein